MKRIMIPLILATLLASSVNAQDIAEWRFGLRIQPSVSWLGTSMKEFEIGSPKINFAYGGIVEKALFKSTVLSTGFLINDFGGNYKYIGDEKSVYFKNRDSVLFVSRKLMLKYVEIPVAMKFRTPVINYLTYCAHFGLDFGFRAKALANDAFDNLKTNETGVYTSEPIIDDVNFMRLGLNMGFGAEYIIAGSTAVFAELNYINGFTNIMRKKSELLRYDAEDGSNVTQIFYGNTISLTIGVLF